jgi:hypothetical protein
MIYPGSVRLARANAGEFFRSFIRPQMPDDVAMPNDGEDTPLGKPFSDDQIARVSANTQHCILLSL